MRSRLNPIGVWTALPLELTQKMNELFGHNFPGPAQKGRFICEGRMYPDELIVRVGYARPERLRQINLEVSVAIPRSEASKISGISEISENSTKEMGQNRMALISTAVDVLSNQWDQYFNLMIEALEAEEDELEFKETGAAAASGADTESEHASNETEYGFAETEVIDQLGWCLHWQPLEWEEQTVYLQYSTINSDLEAEADRLLSLAGIKAVFHDEDLEETDALSRAVIQDDLNEDDPDLEEDHHEHEHNCGHSHDDLDL